MKRINHNVPELSGIQLNGFEELGTKKPYEKNEIVSSDRWHLVDNTSWLHHEAQCLTTALYRQVAQNIQEIINKAFAQTRNGTVAVLALGISLQRLKGSLKILMADKEKRIWGERKRMAEILLRYRCTIFIFENHPDKREQILECLQGEIEETELLMRRTAVQFGVEIPLDPQFTFFDEKGEFENKIEKFKNNSQNS